MEQRDYYSAVACVVAGALWVTAKLIVRHIIHGLIKGRAGVSGWLMVRPGPACWKEAGQSHPRESDLKDGWRSRRRNWKWAQGAIRSRVLAVALMEVICNRGMAAGTWFTLANPATAAVQLMILLPDGTVLAANNPSTSSTNIGFVWYRLTPDPNGHYVLGEWSDIAPMHDPRLFYASQVLTNGRLFVAGGEYGSGGPRAEIYDPLADAWTQINPPTSLLDPTQLSPDLPASFHGGLQAFLDAESKLLPDGRVLVAPVGPKISGGTLIYNAVSNSWANGSTPRGGNQDEASWVKLPDDSILTVDPFSTTSERYIPALTNWIADANVPVSLYSPVGDEMGPALLLANGKAFFLGGSGHTAIYTPSGTTNAGSWVAGPDIPNGLTAADAPAAMMPNGKILCAVAGAPYTNSGSSTEQFSSPTSFFEYDYTVGANGSFTQVNGPTGQTDNVFSYVTAMLDLPDGSILFSDSTEQNFPATGAKLYVYVPDGTPLASGKPFISSITPNADGSFHLVGTGLNGISEGASYGDDAQMDSNFPIIQFEDTNNGHIDYGRTYNWSSTGVRTGTTSTEFALPAGLIPQTYLVSVSANGIISDPVVFSFVNPSSLALCPGGSGSLSVITAPQPATYQWYLNGSPVSGQTGATLNIVGATTNQSGLYTLQVTSGGGTVTSLPVPVSVGIWEVSQPPPRTRRRSASPRL